jgi:thiamine phosphate synthase YjbQ (UPF0047 family)
MCGICFVLLISLIYTEVKYKWGQNMKRSKGNVGSIVVFVQVLVLAAVISLAHGVDKVKAAGDIQITGIVTNSSGTNMDDVSVYATAPGTTDVDFGPVTTASDGSYELDVTAGTYDFHFVPATGSGQGPVVDGNISVLNNQTIDVQLEPATYTYSGTLYGDNGNPISGLQVEVDGSAGSGSATTNSNGQFSMTVPAGIYTNLSFYAARSNSDGATADGYQLASGTGIGSDNDTNIDLSSSNVSQNFTLHFSTVTVTVNDSSGNPEPGATVSANSENGTQTGSTTVDSGGTTSSFSIGNASAGGSTDANGQFTFLVPQGASFTANTIDAGFADGTIARNSNTLTASNDTSIVFQEVPTYTYSGIINDDNGNPISGLQVEVDGSAGSGSATTNSNGQFNMTITAGVYTDLYFLTNNQGGATADGYQLASGMSIGSSNDTSIDLSSSNVSQNFTLHFSTVTATVNDGSGNPEPGATVSANSELAGQSSTTTVDSGGTTSSLPINDVLGSGTTNENGQFTFLVPQGASFGPNSIVADFTDSTVARNSNTLTASNDTSIVFQEVPTYTYSGTLYGDNGNPISGLQVEVDGSAGSGSATTNSNGQFSMTVPAGIYTNLSFYAARSNSDGATADGYQLASGTGIGSDNDTNIDLSSSNVSQNFTLHFSTVTVTVNDSSGNPEPGATVSANSENGTQTGSTTVDSGGTTSSFSIGNASAGGSTDANGQFTFLVPQGASFTANTIDAGFADGTIARNSNTLTASNDTSIVFQEATPSVAPTITSAGSNEINARDKSNFTVTTTGSPAPNITEAGNLPNGLLFTDNGDGTASITGQASTTNQGIYFITLTATNSVGSTSQNFVLSVNNVQEAPTFVSANNVTESYGVPFSFTVDTSGDPIPTISKISGSGNLPSSVTLKDNGDGTAMLSGQLAKASDSGTYTFTVQAKNKNGSVFQPFTLTITKTPVIKSISAKTATIGTSFSQSVSASGDPTPNLSVSGLTSGLSFADSGNGTGNVTGTPTTGSDGTYTVTITASNSEGSSTSNFTIKVKG